MGTTDGPAGADGGARECERLPSRRRTIVPDDDGMYLVRGHLGPEVGAALMRALDAAEDALCRRERAGGEESGAGSPEPGGSAEPASPRQAGRLARRRRADAMGLLAERALEGGMPSTDRRPGA